jgi:hypothetical protein
MVMNCSAKEGTGRPISDQIVPNTALITTGFVALRFTATFHEAVSLSGGGSADCAVDP